MIEYDKIEPFVSGYLKTKLSKELTKGLKDLCLKRNPTINDWNTYDFYYWEEPEIKELNNIQVELVKEYMKIYNSVKVSDVFSFKGWVNIRNEDSWHPPHYHGDCSLILNTYIGVPEGTAVTFMNPNPALTDDGGVYHRIEPEEGTMILTPSWWIHWTEPTYKKEKRISMSSNVNIN